MSANVGYLYFKKYYETLPGKVNTDVNDTILSVEHPENINLPELSELPSNSDDAQPVTRPVELITAYPGLLSGSGYLHEALKNDDAFKIGFHFDHTTGMPIIQGHSVKGMLRSFFPNEFRKKEVTDTYRNLRVQFLNYVLKEIIDDDLEDLSPETITKLEEEIFSGKNPDWDTASEEEKQSGKVNEFYSIYNRDLFLESVPVEITANNSEEKHKRLFGKDYITPHKNKDGIKELDPFSDPNPIKFLKVMPLVKYQFHFRLFDSKVLEELTADKKRDLFQYLLSEFGIGAKTNVGYGQFDLSEEDKEKLEEIRKQKEIERKKIEADRLKKEIEQRMKNDPEFRRIQKLKKDTKHTCHVSGSDKNFFYFKLEWDQDFDRVMKKKSKIKGIERLSEGVEILIEVTQDYHGGDFKDFHILEIK